MLHKAANEETMGAWDASWLDGNNKVLQKLATGSWLGGNNITKFAIGSTKLGWQPKMPLHWGEEDWDWELEVSVS